MIKLVPAVVKKNRPLLGALKGQFEIQDDAKFDTAMAPMSDEELSDWHDARI